MYQFDRSSTYAWNDAQTDAAHPQLAAPSRRRESETRRDQGGAGENTGIVALRAVFLRGRRADLRAVVCPPRLIRWRMCAHWPMRCDYLAFHTLWSVLISRTFLRHTSLRRWFVSGTAYRTRTITDVIACAQSKGRTISPAWLKW